MNTEWYALRSKPRKEQIVWQQARARGFEAFYPRLQVQPVNPRSSKIRPYFPGYLFVQADLRAVGLSTFNCMPYTLGLVSFGGVPAPVSDRLIHALERRLGEIAGAGGEAFFGLKRGDSVTITGGPFEGYRALFDARLSGTERVRVLLQMLSDRQVPVELGVGWIEKVRVQTPAFGQRLTR